MKNIEELPEEIFDLLSDKEFAELTKIEKATVGKYMSEADYEAYRLIIQDFSDLDSSIKVEAPDTSFIDKEASVLKRILTYRIPVYQVAAVILLLIATTFVFSYLDFGKKKSNEGTFSTTPVSSVNFGDDTAKGKRIDELNVEAGSDDGAEGKSLAEDHYPDGLVFNL